MTNTYKPGGSLFSSATLIFTEPLNLPAFCCHIFSPGLLYNESVVELALPCKYICKLKLPLFGLGIILALILFWSLRSLTTRVFDEKVVEGNVVKLGPLTH